MLISADAYRKALALPDADPTRPMGRTRCQLLVRDAAAALRETWKCDLIVHRAQPVVPVADNYELLRVRAGRRGAGRTVHTLRGRLGGAPDAHERQ